MLARISQWSPRTTVHERIALQCAKNISTLAAELPKPRTRSGHVPVLVELRRADEDVIYRYQVNLRPSCLGRDPSSSIAEASEFNQQIKLPCLAHGHVSESSPSPQAPPMLHAVDGEEPQLVMMQDAVHVVHHQDRNASSTNEAVSTFSQWAYASRASKLTRDHFMAALHENQRSPLQFKLLWADNFDFQSDNTDTLQSELFNLDEQPPIELPSMGAQLPEPENEYAPLYPPQPVGGGFQFVPQPKPLPNGTLPMQPPKRTSRNTERPPFQAIDGYKAQPQRHAQYNNNNSNKAQPQRPAQNNNNNSYKAQPQRPAQNNNNNSYKAQPQRRAQNNNNNSNWMSSMRTNYGSGTNYGTNNMNNNKMHNQQNTFRNGHQVGFAAQTSYPSTNRQSNNPRQPEVNFRFNNEAGQQQVYSRGTFQYLSNTHPQTYRLDGINSLYAHLPRVTSYEHHFHLQRELLLRQQLEQDVNHHRLLEQRKYQRSVTESLMSPQVPQELQSLFHWDCCHLCHTSMRTTRNALDHYLSRMHLRRVDSWLIRYSFVKGDLSEDMLRYLRSSGPAVLHCDLCDLKLTSVMHARQHFYGRRHRLVEQHISKPNGEGYYDMTGNWVRTNDKWLMCRVCDVVVTSESQLAIHMAGLRHRKRERCAAPQVSETFDGSHVYRITASGTLVPLNPFGCYLNAETSLMKFRMLQDLNAAYYCEVCNITLNHLKSVKQHEDGRGHRKRLEKVAMAAKNQWVYV